MWLKKNDIVYIFSYVIHFHAASMYRVPSIQQLVNNSENKNLKVCVP